MARETSGELTTAAGAISSRQVIEASAMLTDGAAITEPAAEQIGQTCDAEGSVVTSLQK